MLLYSVGILAALYVAAVLVWVYVVQNVETPAYEVVRQDGAVEVRDYPELVAAEVQTAGARQPAVSAGFRPLARYIFASERPGEKIAMTAPVTQEPAGGGTGSAPIPDGVPKERRWTVRFIMPSKYGLDDLPATGDDTVKLSRIPAARRAAIRFSGVASDDLLDRKTGELLAWAEANGVRLTGAPTFAYYNDPWTPGFLRRNEVLFDVRQ